MAKQRSRKSTGSARSRSAARRPATRASKTSRTRATRSPRATPGSTRARKASPRRRSTAGPEVHSGKPEIGTSHHERSAVMITDHDEIRRWAEDRGGHPACVRGTGRGEDIGMIRIDFPGYSGERSLQPIDWDEWFEKFDDSDLGLLVLPERPDLPGGEKSRFNKLISRETYHDTHDGE